MAAVTLQLKNRCTSLPYHGRITAILTNSAAPKKPLRGLPETIEVPPDATVDAVKAIVARSVGFSDHNRIGLFNPTTSKTLKNRHAKVLEDPDISSAKELLIKDLGTF